MFEAKKAEDVVVSHKALHPQFLVCLQIPGFTFSGNELLASYTPIIMRQHHLQSFAYIDWGITDRADSSELVTIEKERLFIRATGEGSEKETNIKFVLNHLRSIVPDDTMVLK